MQFELKQLALRTNLVILVLLISSSLLCIVVNSWVSIWRILELNTLSFCSILKTGGKQENQRNRETVIKYLIIQSIASALLILFSSYEMIPREIVRLFSLVAILSLIIKSAAAPLHQWFVNIASNMKWMNNIILFTWQKLAPLYLILFQTKKMVLPFILTSAFLGTISIMNKKRLKKIIAFSSVFNLRWIILAICLRTKIFIIFTGIYWISVMFVILIIKKINLRFLEEINKKINKWIPLLLMINLAGLPPLIGFIAKWITFLEGVKIRIKTMVTILLVIRALNLYVYIRIVRVNTIKTSRRLQKDKINTATSLWLFFLVSNTLVIMRVTP